MPHQLLDASDVSLGDHPRAEDMAQVVEAQRPQPSTAEGVLVATPQRRSVKVVAAGSVNLTEPELDALIEAPDRSSWTGRRDHAIITLLVQTGLRASELTGLACGDIHLGPGAHATTTGKSRKQRIAPLTKQTAGVLRVWLAERMMLPPVRRSRIG